MAAGSTGGLPPRDQERIERDLETIRRENGLDVSVLVGDLDLQDITHFRSGAERLHAALGARADDAVLLVVAPGQRRVEVVTGSGVRRRVPDRVCGLAVLSMTSAFEGGDIVGGVSEGLRQIADAAGRREALSPAEAKQADLARRDDAVAGSAHAPAAGAGHDEVQGSVGSRRVSPPA
ncbi:MAG: TPM domain-containing protein [Actinomycetota bacterium]|nr:TPM domain-containing protein [Actinomycetota bacterium]